MRMYWGVEVWLHAFLTSALDGGEWSASRPGRFIPREKAPGNHWVGGWDGPRAGLDVVKSKIPSPCRDFNPRTSSPQPSAIPLRYPGSPSWEVQVYLWMLRCGNFVILTDVLCGKVTTVTSLSLVVSCIFSFPIVDLQRSSLPTYPLKSRNSVFMWYFWNWSNARSSSS
jgi:hypothetical protein